MENIVSIVISSIFSAAVVGGIAWTVSKRLGQTFLEGALKKYQHLLDRQNIEHQVIFTTKYDKQVNAIHDCYSTYIRLYRQIDKIHSGDKYALNKTDTFTELETLLKTRQKFLDSYEPNRIIFPIDLCAKIDSVIPKTNEFIDTYKIGLSANTREEFQEMIENMDGPFFITGMWEAGSFDKVLEDLQIIKTDIEKEFRKLLKTD